MKIFRTFRTKSALFRTYRRTRKTAPIRTAAPLPIGVRGCGAEGWMCGWSSNNRPHRTAPWRQI